MDFEVDQGITIVGTVTNVVEVMGNFVDVEST
jgi:hypothetical protein